MRISIDFTAAVRQGAGIGRYTRGLVDALAQIDDHNEYTLVIFGDQPAAVATSRPAGGLGDYGPNFKPRHLRFSPRMLSIAWHHLRLPIPFELFAGPADLMHSPDFLLPPLARSRGLMTVHDLAFMRVPECADPKLRAYLSREVPRSIARASMILADSENSRHDVMELLDVPGDRIRVVPAGVDSQFRPAAYNDVMSDIAARYQIRGPFIFNLGTLEPRKNQIRLIQAYRQLRELHADAPDLLIGGGKGWLYDGIVQAAEESEPGTVRLLGRVPDADLPALYSMAEIFVFPSLYEGFGLPPLEAMACGTPVICSDRPSLPEVVGDAALLVDPLDSEELAAAMLRLLEDSALRGVLRERGFKQADTFTWTAAAHKLLSVYQEILA